jgi:hypothetical protein
LSKEKRIEELREIQDHELIGKGEFEKQKKQIEEESEVEENPEEEPKNIEEVGKEESKKSDKILIFLILGLVLIFVIFFSYRIFTQDEQPETLDEYHLLNLKGKLDSDLGYLYDDIHSFVFFDGLWYMQLQSPGGTRLYNMALRYGPIDLEDIKIKGRLDSELFDDAVDYYVTFNPTGNDFSHVALAVGDFNSHMTNIFFKNPIAACDRNETLTCSVRPIITCDNTDKVVLYVKEANETDVYYDGNCIVVEGNGFDLVRGVDRVLFNLYDIMGQ